MFSTAERKKARFQSQSSDFISPRTYNFIIGGCILYGFVMNAIIVLTCSDLFTQMNPIAFYIGYFVFCIAGVFLTRSKSALVSFLGYNLVVVPIGAVLSVSLPAFYYKDIIAAVLVTGVVIAIMLGLATAYPSFFAGLGRVLVLSFFVSIIAQVVAMLFGYGGTIFNWIFVILFSLYVGYDWFKAQSYPKTVDNAVDSALDLYLDIINLFIHILAIISKARND